MPERPFSVPAGPNLPQQRIDALEDKLSAGIDALDSKLSARMDTVVLELGKAFGRPAG